MDIFAVERISLCNALGSDGLGFFVAVDQLFGCRSEGATTFIGNDGTEPIPQAAR
jgi:hypothetical protein